MTIFADLIPLLAVGTIIGLLTSLFTRTLMAVTKNSPRVRWRVEVAGFLIAYFCYFALSYVLGLLDAFLVGSVTTTLFVLYLSTAVVSGLISGWLWSTAVKWVGKKT